MTNDDSEIPKIILSTAVIQSKRDGEFGFIQNVKDCEKNLREQGYTEDEVNRGIKRRIIENCIFGIYEANMALLHVGD